MQSRPRSLTSFFEQWHPQQWSNPYQQPFAIFFLHSFRKRVSDLEYQSQIEALNQISILETIPSMRTPRKTTIVTNQQLPKQWHEPKLWTRFLPTKIPLFDEITVPELVLRIININIASSSCTKRLTRLFFMISNRYEQL